MFANLPRATVTPMESFDDARAWRLETDLVLIESYRPGGDHAAFLDLFRNPARDAVPLAEEAFP